MESPIIHYQFKNNFVDSIQKFNGKVEGNPIFLNDRNYDGIVFSTGDIIHVPEVSLSGDYSICAWFEIPLSDSSDYHSLCSGGYDQNSHVPVIIRKSDAHLGVFNSYPFKGFFDCGFNISKLEKGTHHLVAIGDAEKNTTTFYIDGDIVGISNFKSNSKISQIGNTGNEEVGYQQPFGFVADFRVYHKKLSIDEINVIMKSNNHYKLNQTPSKSDKTINSLELKHVSKTFKLYHERRNSVYETITSVFNKNKHYDTLEILKDVSLSIKKGEMMGIIGLNGSGKSTLLKIMAKIYLPDKGEVITNGKVIPLLGLGIGFNPELTARDNIIIYGLLLGFSKKEIESKIEKIIKFAELEKFLDTKLKNFSSGMYARLAFSTALEVDPDILLVDEVLSVGDLPFQEKSFNVFMNFKRLGKTIVFVSHSIEQIQKFCDRVIWIHGGVIRGYGDTNSVLEQYVKFVNTS